MAWTDNLLDASFRGTVFDVRKIDDNADRSTSEHAYPYVDGSDIEDLGRNARRTTVEAIFYGGDYEQRLQAFLKVLDEDGAGELVHPVFGSIKNAQVMRYGVHHEADQVDAAVVSIDFAESTPANPFFDRSLASQKADAIGTGGGVARSLLGGKLADIVGALRAASPLAALDTLRTSMLGPLLALKSEVTSVITSGLDVLSYPRAWATDIAALADGILDLRDFVSGSGGSLKADWNMIVNAFSVLAPYSAPAAGVAPLAAPAMPIVSQADAATAPIVPTEAQAAAATASYVAVASATGQADAAALVLIAEAKTPTLSPPEIEDIAATVRASIEAAIVAVRAVLSLSDSRPIVEALKDEALAVQTAALAIIEARPPLIRRTAAAPGNLRLLAHRWYGDHKRAPELARLNPDLRLPNFIQRGDTLNAFAV